MALAKDGRGWESAMSRLTLTDDKGKRYPVEISGVVPLMECDRATGIVTCPLDATAEELDDYASALARAPVADAFRSYPVLTEPVNLHEPDQRWAGRGR